jgi:hypothetical protein
MVYDPNLTLVYKVFKIAAKDATTKSRSMWNLQTGFFLYVHN